jgi:hypothetical protein
MSDDYASWTCLACLEPIGRDEDGICHMARGRLGGVELPMHPACADTLRGIS